MRVLVVDDDPVLLDNVRTWLTGSGLAVEVAGDAGDALRLADSAAFDVVVLDVMLGTERDGLDVCRALRAARVPTPILMLTARDAVPDRVRGLEAGADDYVVKPFALEELEARIRALARRHLADRSAVLRAADVELDTATGRASVAGAAVALTEKEWRMLEFLLLHPGAPQSQQAIFAAVWGYSEAPASNLVDVYAARLRRKLAAAGARVGVVARKRRGYVLEATTPAESSRVAGARG